MDRMVEGLGLETVFEHAHIEMPAVVINETFKSYALGFTVIIIAVGLYVGNYFWKSGKPNPWELVSKNPILRPIHSFLWNRWYINDLYYAVFVNGLLAFSRGVNGTLEAALLGINDAAPAGFTGLWNQVKKLQTGWLTMNVLYIIGLLLALIFGFVVKGAP